MPGGLGTKPTPSENAALDNTKTEALSTAEHEILAQFSTMPRWKAHELKYAHRDLEQPEALNQAFAKLQTWTADVQRFAKLQDDKKHAKYTAKDTAWTQRLTEILFLDDPLAKDPAKTQLTHDGAQVVEAFLLAYGLGTDDISWYPHAFIIPFNRSRGQWNPSRETDTDFAMPSTVSGWID